MTTERPACPDCDSLDLSRTVRTREYRCKRCTWKGRVPNYREPYTHGGALGGLAGKLEKMDPDDVGASYTEDNSGGSK